MERGGREEEGRRTRGEAAHNGKCRQGGTTGSPGHSQPLDSLFLLSVAGAPFHVIKLAQTSNGVRHGGMFFFRHSLLDLIKKCEGDIA